MAADDDRLEVELAREMIVVLAPSELPLFPAMVRKFDSSPRPPSMEGGAKFNGDVFTQWGPFIIPVAWEVVKFLVVEIGRDLGKEAANQFVRRLLRREPDAVSLTPSQEERVRAIVLDVGQRRKLEKTRAKDLADAIIKRLAVGA